MELAPDFSFQPTTPPIPSLADARPAPPVGLGLLAGLLRSSNDGLTEASWIGTGFNTIWRPAQPSLGSDHFLELNVTSETLQFEGIPGTIPNRGLLQGDLIMAGLRYLQQISDSNLKQGLHVEPGLWLAVPATTDPALQTTVARLASIPHGTTIVAQGITSTTNGPPVIPTVSITPFPIGNPATPITFPEQTLQTNSNFRTSGVGLTDITQGMLDNPNSVLALPADTTIVNTTTLSVSTDSVTPVIGGGTANTAFLQGGTDGPNADAARVDATFWIQTTHGAAEPDVLQYSQTVLLNFKGLSWPHVTVATLKRHV